MKCPQQPYRIRIVSAVLVLECICLVYRNGWIVGGCVDCKHAIRMYVSETSFSGKSSSRSPVLQSEL